MSAVSSTYRVGAFAKLAGVTVRTLHHYDKVGLLHPRRDAGGYRAYTVRDLEMLESIERAGIEARERRVEALKAHADQRRGRTTSRCGRQMRTGRGFVGGLSDSGPGPSR